MLPRRPIPLRIRVRRRRRMVGSCVKVVVVVVMMTMIMMVIIIIIMTMMMMMHQVAEPHQAFGADAAAVGVGAALLRRDQARIRPTGTI
jgi:hypothetical protein